MTPSHKHEVAALTSLIQLGKSLADTVRFWVSTGHLPASERTFATGQVDEFDDAWGDYKALCEEFKRKQSDTNSRNVNARYRKAS